MARGGREKRCVLGSQQSARVRDRSDHHRCLDCDDVPPNGRIVTALFACALFLNAFLLTRLQLTFGVRWSQDLYDNDSTNILAPGGAILRTRWSLRRWNVPLGTPRRLPSPRHRWSMRNVDHLRRDVWHRRRRFVHCRGAHLFEHRCAEIAASKQIGMDSSQASALSRSPSYSDALEIVA
jgi:hypothetical protein